MDGISRSVKKDTYVPSSYETRPFSFFVTKHLSVYSVRARFFNKPWWPMKLLYHHEKCKVDFHAASTRGIPIDLFSLSSFSFLFFL